MPRHATEWRELRGVRCLSMTSRHFQPGAFRLGRSVGCPSLHSEARVRLRRQGYRSSGKASMLAMELSKVCRELVHKFTEFLAGVNCDVFQEDIVDWN